MAIVYNNTLKDARLQVLIDAMSQGSGPGKLVIGTSSLSGATGVLATITLDDPAATKSAGVLTISGTPLTATATATGTAALAEIRDSDDTVLVSGLTVGTSGADVIINATAISTGQTVQLNSSTITHG